MTTQGEVVRAQVIQAPQLNYERLTWDDVHLSAWAMNLVIASGTILRELPD